MGCDIHMHLEVRPPAQEGTNAVAGWRKLSHEVEKTIGDYKYTEDDYVISNRNYTLFSLLADVRNNGDIEPLCQPRGLPRDISIDVKNDAEDWDGDGHSHSYFTIAELKDRLKTYKETRHSGLVDKTQFMEYIKKGRPSMYWQGSSNPTVPQSEMMEAVKNKKDIEADTKVEWTESIKDSCGELFEKIETWEELGNPEDVRIVFWFDN